MSPNKPNTANPFAILNLPVAFDIDDKQLHRNRFELAAANHPDRFEDPLDQADAAERSAAINQAFKQLIDDASRAQVIMSLLGDVADRDEKALPPNLLMEMMEIREEMEDAIAAEDQETLDRLRDWAHEQEATYIKSLRKLLASAGACDADDTQARQGFLQEAQVSLNALRYIKRMLEQMPPEMID